MRLGGRTARAGAVLGALAAGIAPALAHPHVFVEVRAQVLFGPDGKVTGVHHDWVFDEMYSAYAIAGLKANSEPARSAELTERARENVNDLKEYDYFTFAKAGGRKLKFAAPIGYTMDERPDKRVMLHFTLPLSEPTKTGRALSLQIYDPTYYVDFELAAKDPVALKDAPAGCSQSVFGANPLVVADGQALAKQFDTGLVPSDDFALKMASSVIVACP